jgi:hypothetical protein
MVHRLIMKTAASSMARGRDGFGWCVSVSVECHPHNGLHVVIDMAHVYFVLQGRSFW